MADRELRQADIFWVEADEPFGSEPGFRRPWLIVQNDLTNATAINTILACPLTTNLRHAQAPGNVVIQAGESGLHITSVIQAVGLSALDRYRFDEFVGRIDRRKLGAVLAGILGLLEPRGP